MFVLHSVKNELTVDGLQDRFNNHCMLLYVFWFVSSEFNLLDFHIDFAFLKLFFDDAKWCPTEI